MDNAVQFDSLVQHCFCRRMDHCVYILNLDFTTTVESNRILQYVQYMNLNLNLTVNLNLESTDLYSFAPTRMMSSDIGIFNPNDFR